MAQKKNKGIERTRQKKVYGCSSIMICMCGILDSSSSTMWFSKNHLEWPPELQERSVPRKVSLSKEREAVSEKSSYFSLPWN